MTEIDYGRLDAIEAVLGGRAAIEAAYKTGSQLTGGGGLPAPVSRDLTPFLDKLAHQPSDPSVATLVIVPACSVQGAAYNSTVFVTLRHAVSDGQGGWNYTLLDELQVGWGGDTSGGVVSAPTSLSLKGSLVGIIPAGDAYAIDWAGAVSFSTITEQPLG